MKKLLTILSIVTLLAGGITFGLFAAKEVKQSIHKYISNDVVGESGDTDNSAVDNSGDKYTKIDNPTDITSDIASNKESAGQNSNKENISSVEADTKSADDKGQNIVDNSDSYTGTDGDSETDGITDTDGNTDIDGNADIDESISISPALSDSQSIINEINKEEMQQQAMQDETQEAIDQSEENQNNDMAADNSEDAVETALNITNPSIKIDATSAILIDTTTSKVLFYKNATEPIYPASTTKLMTALVALDVCDLKDEITIGSEINSIAEDSSRAYLEEGQCLTLNMLLEGMLIPSGNDAAYAIAAYVGRVSLKDKEADNKSAIKEFVRLMNEKVKMLGLTNTTFKNPDGYDTEGQVTTAYDMGMIAVAALNNNIISDICGKSKAENIFLSGEDVTWYSSNKLIVSGSGDYFKYAVGLKTGSSSKAGKCLISAAKKEDKACISVVMNSTSTGRWEDSIALLEYGLEN